MRKPNLMSLLTASVVAGAGSFAVAQQGMDQSQQDQQSQQRQQQSQQAQQATQQSQQSSQQGQQKESKTVKGKVVDLQQWLQEQGQQSQASSQQGQQSQMGQSQMGQQSQMARGSHPLAPKAIVTDDGKVHVVLGMTSASDRFSQSQSQRSDRLSLDSNRSTGLEAGADINAGAGVGQSGLDTESTQRTQLSDGYELPTDRAGQDRQSDRDSLAIDTDRESETDLTRTPGLDRNIESRADNMAGGAEIAIDSESGLETQGQLGQSGQQSELGQSSQPGQSSRLGQSGQQDRFGQSSQSSQLGQSDQSSQVMGFARPAAELRIGQQVEVTGYVFERQGVQGILITDVSPAQDQQQGQQ